MNDAMVKGKNKVGSRVISFSMLCMFTFLVVISGCTKHLAPGATNTPTTASIGPLTPPKLADSLIGTWKILRTEIPPSLNGGAAFGSQADKDAIAAKQKEVQDQFLSLSATFNKDKIFQSIFSGSSDIGTWRITDQMEIETTSKTSGRVSTYAVQSLTAGQLTLKYGATDLMILLIFKKQ